MLLDIDPLSGAIETMEYDHVTKGLIITRSENVDAILDLNTASYNDSSQGWRGEDNDFWHVARVPMTTLEAWRQEYNSVRPRDAWHPSIFTDSPEWDAFVWMRLNSSDFRKLRTAPVHV